MKVSQKEILAVNREVTYQMHHIYNKTRVLYFPINMFSRPGTSVNKSPSVTIQENSICLLLAQQQRKALLSANGRGNCLSYSF